MAIIGSIKHSLTHIPENAIHFQLTKMVYGDKTYGKACSYYWIKLPSALAMLSFATLALVFFTVLFSFLGKVPTFIGPSNAVNANRALYPYKTLPNGKRLPVAPWEIVLALIVIYFAWSTIENENLRGEIFGVLTVIFSILVGLIAIGGLIFLISKGWNVPAIQYARNKVVDAWDRTCPTLVVEEKENT